MIVERKKTKDGYNTTLKFVVESINQYGGSNGKKGFLFSDCDLTAHDMNYLSATMISSSYNFEIIDFSNNPKIDALAIDYLLKGATGILSVKQGNLTDMNLMYQGILSRYNFVFHKLDLSGCNIGDVGADILGHALANGKLKCLKNIDISGNNISTPKITELLKQVSQDLFVVTEKSYEEGKAVYKDTSGKLYDMHIKSDGKDAIVEFADGITGISGVSAGDTCPAPVKDQIIGCIKGGLTTTVGATVGCLASTSAYPVCVASAALVGCGVSLVGVGISPCVDNAYNSIENYFKGGSDNDKGFGFSATGGTEIKGTTIDNDHGPIGSNFDLSQHDF